MKDLSVVSLIPEFSGAINGAGKVVSWAGDDNIYAANIKLTGVAKTFYTGSTEFHVENTTWERFKQRLQDIMQDQFHYLQLLTVKQRKDADSQTFVDRVRTLAKKTLPSSRIPAVQDRARKATIVGVGPWIASRHFNAGKV
ncbi:hypothetical protein L798_10640 [Zootermopsis nevadensis]|uniref:Uncharacterized protein n=1 Tax=Zootermopsis nevadensis TaxID=136037 RepID=A0A067QXS3_ZOONE|nr:hypothetical protein L798_10640 [Zootermopsis nevadensis]